MRTEIVSRIRAADQRYWLLETDIPALASVLRIIAPASVVWLAAALGVVAVALAVALDVVLDVVAADELLLLESPPEDSAA